jgi:hypothetical protein
MEGVSRQEKRMIDMLLLAPAVLACSVGLTVGSVLFISGLAGLLKEKP